MKLNLIQIKSNRKKISWLPSGTLGDCRSITGEFNRCYLTWQPAPILCLEEIFSIS